MVAVTMFYSAIHGIFISHPTCLSAREPLLWNKALFYLNPIMYPTNVSDFFFNLKKIYERTINDTKYRTVKTQIMS